MSKKESKEPRLEDIPLLSPEAPEFSGHLNEESFWEGRRGSLDDILGRHFEENKRSAVAKLLRPVGILAAAATGVGICWLSCNHVLVEDGYIGLTMNNGVPEIIGPGHHFVLSPLNGEVKVVPVTDPQIIYHSLSIITVFEEKLGLGFEQGRPIVLKPGVHVINSPYFQFNRFVTQDENFSHGTIHRYIIKSGERALAWEGNVPMILTEGIYQRVSPLFKFVKSKRIDQAVVDLKPFSVVTVDEGRVGVCYDRGQLSVLLPGEHWLNAEKNQKFLSFLPTTQQVKGLKTLEVLTTDGLLVRIKGSITFRIQDPHTAIINIGSSDTDLTSDLTNTIFNTIMHRANDTLASILTGTDILSTAGMGFASSSIMTKAAGDNPGLVETNEVDDLKEERKEGKEEDAGDVGDVIRHRFKESLTATLRQEWGVELRDMNVIDVQVMDKSVRDALAEGVRCNIVAVTDRRTAESKAETARILAAGKRDASKFATDGDTYAVTEMAEAQKKAGQLLETTPVAVQLRLAETAASAIAATKSTMIVSQAADAQSLLRLIDSSKRAMGQGVSTSGRLT